MGKGGMGAGVEIYGEREGDNIYTMYRNIYIYVYSLYLYYVYRKRRRGGG